MKRLLVLFILVNLFTFPCIAKKQVTSDTALNQAIVIHEIILLGNKRTKSWVIHRELSFALGDTVTKFELLNKFETSKNNITNTSLFTYVDMRFVMEDDLNAVVYVAVSERWYLWPIPVFELAETNFNSWWENKDFSRINYGIDLTQNNFRGRNETLKLTLQFGFTEKLAISYSIPYIDKNRTIGLSFHAESGQNHEVNYISDNNKRIFYKDIQRIQLQNSGAGFNIRYRRKFFSTHIVGGAYSQVSISDTIAAYNPDYLNSGETNLKFLSFSYRYILDKRDNKSYALTGHYFSAWAVKYGFHALSPDIDLWWNKFEYRHYWKIARKTYLAGLTQCQFYMNDFQPYYFRDGLGYEDKNTVRSYELYVIDAQQMGVAKLQLRYQLLSPRTWDMTMMPVNKFKRIRYAVYLGVFGDAGFAHDQYRYPNNNLADEIQFGSGVSLDIATYYDLIFRAEYSMNKFGEHGLFLHFVAPI